MILTSLSLSLVRAGPAASGRYGRGAVVQVKMFAVALGQQAADLESVLVAPCRAGPTV